MKKAGSIDVNIPSSQTFDGGTGVGFYIGGGVYSDGAEISPVTLRRCPRASSNPGEAPRRTEWGDAPT